MSKRSELQQTIDKLVVQQRQLIDDYSEVVDGKKSFGAKATPDILNQFNKRQEELDKLVAERDKLAAEENLAQKSLEQFELHGSRHNSGGMFGGPEMSEPHAHPTFEEQLSSAMKSVNGNLESLSNLRFGLGDYDQSRSHCMEAVKTTMLSTGVPGYPIDQPRISRVQEMAREPLWFADMVPNIPTSLATFAYLEETAEVNSAAAVAENALKPESDFTLVERVVSLRTVAHIMRFTKQQLEDIPAFADFVRSRGLIMLNQKIENFLLNSNGVAPNILGFNNVGGIQTQDNNPVGFVDAVAMAQTKIRTVGKAIADLVVCNPTDWDDVRLLKTTDGHYIWGHPSLGGPATLWGMQVRSTTYQAAGTQLVGAFRDHSNTYTKGGIEVVMTGTDGNDFSYNRMALRIERRMANVVYRPQAFCLCSNI